jgi:hypothetical protein
MDWGSLRDVDGKVFTTIITKQLILIDQGGNTCLHEEIPGDPWRIQQLL